MVWKPCASSPTSSVRRASRSTIRGSCRSYRPHRRRRRSCSIWWSVPRASTGARGSRVAAPSSPRTRRCGTSTNLVGFPESAGGVFVTGGTAGNLSALLAARFRWRHRAAGAHDRTRGLLLTCSGAHSSVGSAARAIDADVELVPADGHGRLWGWALRETLARLSAEDRDRLFAVVATAGTTNAGVIDDLAGIAEVCAEFERVAARRRCLRRCRSGRAERA